jgi:hypothetical protein
MRRMQIVALTALILTALIFAYSQTPQTPGATAALQSIQVNARTITALRKGKKYVVDLTRRGVKYEFDSKTSRIDFNRVMVRTAQGEVALGSFLEKTFLKDELAAFKYTSQRFSLGTGPGGTLTGPSKIISCDNPDYCHCEGVTDCKALLNSSLCPGASMCTLNRYGEEESCVCRRHE